MTHALTATRSPHRQGLISCVAALAALAALSGAAQAADPVKPNEAKAGAKPAAKPAPRPATPREQLKSEAQGLALATETVEQISDAQLDVAARVLTGPAQCEFNQTVTVDAVEGKPGYFVVGFKGQRYLAVPQETSTGAVRLEDRKAGIVWLQIPVKSMLMNSHVGKRLVDACTHPEQRAAVHAAEVAGRAGAATSTTK